MPDPVKYLRVEMPDDSKWDVPANLVAHNRAEHYSAKQADKAKRAEVFQDEYAYTLDNHDELIDWAANNMNWDDVRMHAKRVKANTRPTDFQEGWVNGEKEVVDHKQHLRDVE